MRGLPQRGARAQISPSINAEHEILPDMAEETNLDAAETAAVRAYVLSVLKSPVAAEG